MISALMALFGKAPAATGDRHDQTVLEPQSFEAALRTALQDGALATPPTGLASVIPESVTAQRGADDVDDAMAASHDGSAEDPVLASVRPTNTAVIGDLAEVVAVPMASSRQPVDVVATTVRETQGTEPADQRDATEVQTANAAAPMEKEAQAPLQNGPTPSVPDAQPALATRDETEPTTRPSGHVLQANNFPEKTVPSAASSRRAADATDDDLDPTPSGPERAVRTHGSDATHRAVQPSDETAGRMTTPVVANPAAFLEDGPVIPKAADTEDSDHTGTRFTSDNRTSAPSADVSRTGSPRAADSFEPIRWNVDSGGKTLQPRTVDDHHHTVISARTDGASIESANRPRVWTAASLQGDSTRHVNDAVTPIEWKSVEALVEDRGAHVRIERIDLPDRSIGSDQKRPAAVGSIRIAAPRSSPTRATDDAGNGGHDALKGRVERTKDDWRSPSQATDTPNDPVAAPTTSGSSARSTTGTSVSTTAAVTPSSTLLETVDSSRAAAVPSRSSVTLRVDDDSGVAASIRIAVRGDQVHASIVHDDPTVAARLASQTDQLHQSLSARGFGDSSIAVHAATASSAANTGSSSAHDRHDDTGRSPERDFRAPDRGPGDDRRGEHRESRRHDAWVRDRSWHERER